MNESLIQHLDNVLACNLPFVRAADVVDASQIYFECRTPLSIVEQYEMSSELYNKNARV